MKPSSRIALAALTHGLALAVGWAIYQASGFQAAENPVDQAATGRTRVADRSAVDLKSGKDILAGVLKSVSEEPRKMLGNEYDRGADNTVPKTDQDILDRIHSIEIPADFAKAFEKLMPKMNGKPSREDMAEASALAFHWLSKNPQAFFDWLKADPKRQIVGLRVFNNLVPELFRRSGVEGVIPLAMAGDFKYQIIWDLGRSLAKSGDTAGIAKAKQLLASDPGCWRSFALSIGSEWPNEKLADLIKLAVACDEPQIAIGHKNHGKDHGVYIAGLLADESLPEDFRKRISDNPLARNGLVRDSSVPLELRLQNGGNLDQIVNNDVGRLLTEDRDWAFAFRKGEVSAQEIMDRITAGTPDLANSQPDALRMQVFRELAEENPAAAMTLLKDLPEDERSERALFASRTHFTDVEPDKFLELMQQIPAETPEQWEGRLDAWNRRGFTNNERLQDGYVEWVRELPPGLDREMALYSLARAVNESNPKLAADLRGQVTDSKLQQRISKHR